MEKWYVNEQLLLDFTLKALQIPYPGYQLNPGDMFQVDPERVLFATGTPKNAAERRSGRVARKRLAVQKAKSLEDEQEQNPAESPEPVVDDTHRNQTPKQTLKDFMSQAKTLLSTPSTSLSAKRKQDLRAFQKSVKQALSRRDDLATAPLDKQLQQIMTKMAPEPEPPKADVEQTEEAPQLSTQTLQAKAADLTSEQKKTLKAALEQARDNPVDPTKAYATPWQPRQYMSAFAFIPRYLEVNQKICAAVYLRHPVARPGLAEVPTPFDQEINGLAHNWYLRRR